MPEVSSTITPGPRTITSEGNVPLPIVWGDHFESLERGGYLEPKTSDDVDISADSDGHKYVRAGSVLIRTSSSEWQLLKTSTDAEPVGQGLQDGMADEVVNADAVGILKTTVDLKNGGGYVGIYLAGGFFASRMPSVAANGTPGLEATVVAALKARGFRFAEDYS